MVFRQAESPMVHLGGEKQAWTQMSALLGFGTGTFWDVRSWTNAADSPRQMALCGLPTPSQVLLKEDLPKHP